MTCGKRKAGSYRAVRYSRELEGKWTPENKEQISTVRYRAGKVVAVALASSSTYFETSRSQQPELFFFFFNAAGMSSSANCYQLQEESLLFTEQIHKKQNEKNLFSICSFRDPEMPYSLTHKEHCCRRSTSMGIKTSEFGSPREVTQINLSSTSKMP